MAISDDIQKLYIAYFNRPADVAGLNYWTEQVNNHGGSTAAIANAFSASAEYQSIYSGLSSMQIVNTIYQNLFGRSAEVDGLTYWSLRLDNGTFNIGNIALSIMQGAQGSDATAVASKVTAAAAFTTALDTTAEILAYSGATANATAKTWLSSVVDATTLTTAQSSLTSTISSISNTTVANGTTFTLTTAADNITGTSSNDTVRGTVTLDTDGVATSASTYSTADQVSGGAGTDTLTLTVEGSGTGGVTTNAPAASVSSIETVSIRNVTAATEFFAFNGSNVGATNFVVDRSTGGVNLSNIGTADVTIAGDGATATGAVNVTTVSSSSVTDAFVLNLQGGTTTDGSFAVSDSSNANWTSATINSTGANSFGTIALSNTTNKVTSLTINADTRLQTGTISGFDTTNKATITVAGAATASTTNAGVSIGTLDNAVKEVNASGLTAGGLQMTLSGTDGVSTLKVTGGAGNDKITTGSTALSTSASIDAGAGTADVLVVAASGHIDATLGKVYKNFEVAQVEGGVSLDLNNLTDGNTISAIRINATTDGATATNLTATQAGAVTIVAGSGAAATSDATDAAITLAVKNASDVGQIDTLNLTFNDGNTATNTINLNYTDGGIVMAGVENLVLNASADKSLVVLGTDAAALTSLTLSGAQDQNVSFAAAYTFNTNTAINGSTATGALTINTAAATDSTAAIAITGGSKGDAITFYAGAATAASDAPASVINGGAGLDTVTVVATTDVVTDGTTDTTVSFKIVSDVVASANADDVLMYDSTGTDLATDGYSTDSTWSYKYTGALSNGTGTSSDGIVSGEIVSNATVAGALADGSAGNAIVFRVTNTLATSGTSLATLAGSFTQANIDAFISGLVATGGSLNGSIANLDSVLGTSDSALMILDDGTYSAILRLTNTDTAVANTLTASEIALVGVVNVNDLGAGGAAGTITW